MIALRSPEPPVGIAIVVLLFALALNAGGLSLRTGAVLFAVGLGGLLSAASWKRLATWALGMVVVGLMALAVARGAGSARAGVAVALRATTGLTWCFWFASVAQWRDLKELCRRARSLRGLAEVIDLGVAHGWLFMQELRLRMDASAVRQGFSRWDAMLPSYGLVLAGTIDGAIARGVALEETRRLREAPCASKIVGSPLVLRDVTLRGRHGQDRVHAVSLAVERGACCAVLGPSGSGKSTLLRLAAGLETPNAGFVARFGEIVSGTSSRARVDRRVAFIFQNPDDQFLGSTPLDDVAWGLERQGFAIPDAARRAMAALETLEVAHLAYRPVGELSFGEKKRVALAGALACEPELLLCDEPTSGLDPVASRRLIRLIEEEVRSRRIAVVWVTHDLDALPSAVSEIVLLREGQIVFSGERRAALAPERLRATGLLEPEGAASARDPFVETRRLA